MASALVPRQRDSIVWGRQATGAADPVDLRVVISRSIVGRLRLPADAEELRISDSIVDAATAEGQLAIGGVADDQPSPPHSPPAGAIYGPPTSLQGTTIFGLVVVREFGDVSNTIFTGCVTVQRLQVGAISYSYVPPGSTTPRRWRCQPDLALGESGADQAIIAARIKPVFESTSYGQPGYGQLSPICPQQISRGSEDESEMGAFGILRAAMRENNLLAALREYLPAGFEPGIFYAT